MRRTEFIKITRRAACALALIVGVPSAVALGVGPLASVSGASPPSLPGTPAVVGVVTSSAYGLSDGPILVATIDGLGNIPLYEISSDDPPFFGCTTVLEPTFEGTITCTGPESDFVKELSTITTNDEWPAFTTSGPITTGPGVQRRLLGTVYRPGVGLQVTYAGHPLYLFSPPLTFAPPFGEGFLETVLPLPPWHGLWGLVSATTGNRATGHAKLETETLHGKTTLAVEEYTTAGAIGITTGVAVTVYDFCPGPTRDRGPSTSCAPAFGPRHGGTFGLAFPGSFTRSWIPVLTQGAATAIDGVPAASLGTVRTSEGTQVTFNGNPLYIYASEMAVWTPPYTPAHPTPPEFTGTAGNGAGVPGPGVTAHVVPIT